MGCSLPHTFSLIFHKIGTYLASILSTADRAKQIKTKAVVNEDPTEKLLRELREENEKLKKMMQGGKIDKDFIDSDGNGIDDRSESFVVVYAETHFSISNTCSFSLLQLFLRRWTHQRPLMFPCSYEL